ncbi:hypothetical protein ACM6Q7_11475 [Peribacillus butanolivorans]
MKIYNLLRLTNGILSIKPNHFLVHFETIWKEDYAAGYNMVYQIHSVESSK